AAPRNRLGSLRIPWAPTSWSDDQAPLKPQPDAHGEPGPAPTSWSDDQAPLKLTAGIVADRRIRRPTSWSDGQAPLKRHGRERKRRVRLRTYILVRRPGPVEASKKCQRSTGR